MKRTIIYIMIAFPVIAAAQSNYGCQLKEQIISDYQKFYSTHNLWKLTLAIGYAGFYSNTAFDQEIQDFYAEYIKTPATDKISKVAKQFGNGRIMVPIYLTAAVLGELTKDAQTASTVGNWGQRCSRALIVGAPLVLTLQVMTGASRPYENNGSHWHPFKDNNGVSGHSFMGAVPFLTAAKMAHQQGLKYAFYLGSTLTGLSRINDNQHYFSQAFLGWWIAWLSVSSVDKNKIAMVTSANGIGVEIYF